MNEALVKKVKSIFDANNGDYLRLIISIECPLDSGLKATGLLTGDDGEIYVPLGSVKDFFLFVGEYRKENPEHQFNRVSIVATILGVIDVDFSFDEELHKQTMENIE